MERKNKCKNIGFSTILWAVGVLLLCTVPCSSAIIVNSGTYSLNNRVTDSIRVDSGGTIEVLEEGYAVYGVSIEGGSIEIYGSHTWNASDEEVRIAVSENATLFADSTSSILFENIDENTPQIGSATLNGTTITVDSTTGWVGKLTWIYDSDPYSLNISINKGITVQVVVGEDPIKVEIDIKPGSYPNSVNINGHGVIPVAILGSADFDVTQIEVNDEALPLTFAGLAVRIKGNGLPQCSIDDVSGPEGVPDGWDDLVCQFVDDSELWEPGDDIAELTGFLEDGTQFAGTDDIRVVQVQE